MTSGQWLPQQASFELVRRGYSPEQVNEFLDRTEYDLRIITADRDSANQRVSELSGQMAAVRAEVDELRTQLDRTALEPTSMVGLSDRMQRMIRLAEEEAAEIRASGEQDIIRARAALESGQQDLADERAAFDAERKEIRQQLNDQVRELIAAATTESERKRSEADQEAAATVGAAQATATRLTEEATAERERLDAESASHRQQTEIDAAQILGDAQAGALRLITEAQAEAERLVSTAQAKADALDADSLAIRNAEEEDFEIAIAAKRQEAHQTIADREEESQATAERLVADAKAHSQHLVQEASARSQAMVAHATAEAYRRVEEADQAVISLTALRRSVAGQLAGILPQIDQIRQIATEGVNSVDPLPAEPGRPVAEDFHPDVADEFDPADLPAEEPAEAATR